jgi:hypothetical protein
LENAEKARLLGYTPPTKDTFAEFLPRYLQHQKARLTPAAYERTRGIVETHLRPYFGQTQLSLIRRKKCRVISLQGYAMLVWKRHARNFLCLVKCSRLPWIGS